MCLQGIPVAYYTYLHLPTHPAAAAGGGVQWHEMFTLMGSKADGDSYNTYYVPVCLH